MNFNSILNSYWWFGVLETMKVFKILIFILILFDSVFVESTVHVTNPGFDKPSLELANMAMVIVIEIIVIVNHLIIRLLAVYNMFLRFKVGS